jgi:hypothetical protein
VDRVWEIRLADLLSLAVRREGRDSLLQGHSDAFIVGVNDSNGGFMKFENMVAIVTGSGQGIGRATARALAQEGTKIVLNARNRESLERVGAEIEDLGSESIIVSGNISHISIVKKAVEGTLAKFGRIDILFNNAGSGRTLTGEYVAYENLKENIQVSTGPWRRRARGPWNQNNILTLRQYPALRPIAPLLDHEKLSERKVKAKVPPQRAPESGGPAKDAQMPRPPSTSKLAPVIKEASSDARNKAV